MPAAPQDILQQLKSKQYSPLYFLQGEEPYYIDAIGDFIEKNALEESQKGFNQVILYGKEVDMNTVISNAKRFPMMSDRQVVIVKEAQEIKDVNKEAGVKILEAYAKAPQASTILVFCHKNKTLDGRKSLAKTLDKFAVLVTSKKMYDNQVPDWISDQMKAKKRSISQKGIAMLCESIGNNLSAMVNEIDKVLLNVKEGEEVTEEHISKYVGISKDYNVFELQKALTSRNALKCFKIVNYFDKNAKDHPIIPMLAIMYGFFTKILLVHQSSNKNENHLAGVLKVNRFFIRDYMAASRSYKLHSVLAIIGFISEADLRSKGILPGQYSDGAVLKELVAKMLAA
ncbi:MAG: DNA polymerase III subunit delta [Cyclobacteriaceae bacterium]